MSQKPPAIYPPAGKAIGVQGIGALPVPRRLLLALTFRRRWNFAVSLYLSSRRRRPTRLQPLATSHQHAQSRARRLAATREFYHVRSQRNLVGPGVSKDSERGPCATWYPRVRAIEGVGLIMIGFFSTDPAPGYPPGTLRTSTTLQGGIHLAFTILVVNMMALGLSVISRRFWKDPNFPGWTAFSIVTGLLTFVFMTAFGVSNATHSGYPGLFERLATNTDTVWGAALLIPLWRGRRFMRLDASETRCT